jgi:SagB-type dehydrogenase family enzyme
VYGENEPTVDDDSTDRSGRPTPNVFPESTVPFTMTDARTYHERTKHSPASVRTSGHRLDFENKPIPYKIYEDLPSVPLASEIRPFQMPTLTAITGPGEGHDVEHVPDHDAERLPDLDAITQLCYYAAGITKTIERGDHEFEFRAAACTGALYHIDLYLVCGDLPNLDAGVYHFDPRTLSLDVLRNGDYRGVLAEATGDLEAVVHAPVTVVATSTWWRNAWKYRERTYRHAFWDSGTVLVNALAVARSLDLPAEVVMGFADGRVNHLLGTDPDYEGALALLPAGFADDPAPDPPAVESIGPETRPLSPDPVHYDLIADAYRASALQDGDDAREWRAARPGGEGVGTRSPSPEVGEGDRVPLEPVGDDRASKVPLHVTVPRRGSCREYRREPIAFRKFSTILDRATRGFRADFRDPDGLGLQYNDAYLIVNSVDSLPSGTYHYHPDAADLERLQSGEFRRNAGHLALDQRLGADAAVCVYFLTDLDAVAEKLGNRGYRAAQLEASLAAGKLYLGAYAHRDLGATGLTFYDDAVTEFFEPRAEGQTPTFLWTVGRPA